MRHKVLGLTLVELMVTIGVVAVMMLIAVPSFQNYTANQRVRSTASDLLAAMNFARSEAIKRNIDVRVERDTNWINGWIIEATIDGADETLLSYGAQDGVTITATPSATDISYGSDGRLNGTSSFTFDVAEDPDLSAIEPSCVRVSLSGRPVIDKGACS